MTPEEIMPAFNLAVQTAVETVRNSAWGGTSYEASAVATLLRANLPDAYDWQIKTTMSGDYNVVFLSYTPTLEDIISVH